MKFTKLRSLTALIAGMFTGANASAQDIQDLLPMESGYVVSTCHSNTSIHNITQDPDGFVVALIDGTASELSAAGTGAVAGGAYPWRMFHNEVSLQVAPDPQQEWTAGNLGEVFGITLDDARPANIYVSATAVYGSYAVPAGNSQGTVYRLDGTTGSITPYNCIPAGSASLGNLTHWRASSGTGNLYVSNLDDGLIYQLDSSGDCVGTYDHGVQGRPQESMSTLADNASTNYTQLGRRVWGVEAHDDRLFYGVWNTAGAHTVWSVELDASGTPDATTAQIEIPMIPGDLPVSDISFSEDGRLFLAQRYHRGVGLNGPHNGSVLEYTFAGGSWNISPIDKFKVGNYSTFTGSGRNSAGGVSVDCAGAVWASGDALNLVYPNYIYGVQRISPLGNQADVPNVSNSHVVDLDGITDIAPKTFIGDVEVYDECNSCFDITDLTIDCPRELGAPFTATFTLTNQSSQTAAYLLHTPCPDDELATGAVTDQILQVGLQPLDAPLGTGESTVVTVQIPSASVNADDRFCWNIVLLDRTGGECCRDKVCVTIPDCECFVILDKEINCEVTADGSVKYFIDFNIMNTSDFTWNTMNLLPSNPLNPNPFAPGSFDLSSSPVAPGSTYQFQTCLTGNPGEELCFFLSVHAENYDICCSKECCVILPECEGVQSDRCDVTLQAPCCRDANGNVFAEISLVICNNSAFPRTYNWNIGPGSMGAGCNTILANSAFVTPSGNITVGPNDCESIVIRVNCERLQMGQRACFEVCIEQEGNPNNHFCCEGQIYVPSDADPDLKIQNPIINNDSPQSTFTVSNPGNTERRFIFEVASLRPWIEIVSISQGREEPALNQLIDITLAPGETREVLIQVTESRTTDQREALNPILVTRINEKGQTVESIGSLVYVITPEDEPLRVKSLTASRTGQLTFHIATQPGRSYALQSSTTLDRDAIWEFTTCTAPDSPQISSKFIAQSKELVLTLTPNPECATNFYRAVELEAAE